MLKPSLLFLILFVFLALSALISATEIAIISFNKIRLKHLLHKGAKRAQAVYEIVTHLDHFITFILILNNLVNISISAIITSLFIFILGYKSVALSVFFTSLIIIIFGEMTPKLFGSRVPERLSLAVSPYLVILLRIFKPVIKVISRLGTALTNILLRLGRITPRPHVSLVTEEEIKLMIEVGREEGLLGEKEKEMLHRIFELGRTRVKDIMVHREDMVMFNLEGKPEEIIRRALEAAHSRFPVYRGSPHNIVGLINTKDIIYLRENANLVVAEDLVSDIYRVSGEMTAGELFREFQKKKTQIALVLGDKGEVAGLVTLEDLVEEIVGELEEEKIPRKL
jgi:putative hemolysin